VSRSEPSRLVLDEAIRFRRDVGASLGRDESRNVHFTIREPGEFAELATSLNMDRVIEVTFQVVAFQPPDIIVRGEELTMYLADAQVSLHLPLLSQAFETALANQDR
jgi:hypothetical protein